MASKTGLPILATAAHLNSYLSASFTENVTHVHGSTFLPTSVCQTAPAWMGLANPHRGCKSAVSTSSMKDPHVLLFGVSADIPLSVATAFKLALPGDRVTMLVPCAAGERAEEGDYTLTHHSDFLFPAAELNNLGYTTEQCTTHFVSHAGTHLVMMSMFSKILSVVEKTKTCTHTPDSCTQPEQHNTVHTPDLSSTCIEFVGTIHDRECKVLLDSGATANFVSDQFVKELNLPTAPLKTPVSVNLADGRNSVSNHSAEVDLVLGSLHCRVQCIPTTLQHYDLVLGKPWLTEYNPNVNWKLNVVHLLKDSTTHVLLGSSRSGLPKYLVSALQAEKLLGKSKECYIIKLHSLSLGQEGNADRPELERLLQEFNDILSGLPDGLPPARAGDHTINLVPGSNPPASKIYPLSGAQLAELRAQLQELLERGFIRPSTSPFGAPILFVPKKDGGWRLCIDYRALNKITIRNQHPLPRIDEMFEQLHGSAFFTKLDLASGYHQIRMSQDSIEKTAFKTKYGHYEFTVMPFGLTNAPATFQCVMNSILSPYLDRFVLVYLDDILIYSKTYEEHLEHLRTILQVLRDNKFYCKRSKCLFAATEVEYLGHLLTPHGVQVDPKKVEAIINWPTPTNVTQLRSFMGLLQYYDTFIDHFAEVAFPLTELFKKDVPWAWNDEHVHAFQELKRLVSSPPCLLMPDLEKPFVVHVDASGFAIGCVLQQDQGMGLQPVAFESRKLQPPERHLAPYDRELIALTHALMKWKHLLLGAKFTLHTDQQALKYLLTAPTRTSRQERWLTEIMRFMPDIKYVKGTDNVVADALSRRVDLAILHVSSLLSSSLLQELADLSGKDLEGQRLLARGTLVLRENLLFTSTDKIFIPEALREKIISECHSTKCSGHLGTHKTYELACRNFWWPAMNSTVRLFCRKCETCQRTKGPNTLPLGLLQPLPIPDEPWQSISMDLVTDLPPCCGHDSIFVVVDRLTKLIVLTPCKKTITAPQLAQLFIDNVYKRFGMPTSIVSDRDPRFTSHFWKTFMHLLGTQLNMSTAYHPQTDGQTERANRTIEDMLRGFVGPRQDDWCIYLSLIEFAYNNSLQASTLHTPFFLNHGRHPITPLSSAVPKHSPNPAVTNFVEELQNALRSAKSNISSAQQRQKSYADRKRKDHSFKVGDQVLLAARQNQLPPGLSSKLSAKFHGPFPIVATVGSHAFKLELPDTVTIHPVFHVSQLKPFVPSDHSTEPTQPPPLYTDKAGAIYDVETILAKKKVGKSWKFLVKWKGFDDFENTWEPLRNVRKLSDLIAAAPIVS